VLAQQIVAEVACRDWKEKDLYALLRRAYPYRDLGVEQFTAVLRMLAEGYATRVGVRGAYLHRDTVNGMLRARRGARLTAVSSGGTIPDTADYEVLLEPQSIRIGTVNEDFAVESLAGDIFQLGNLSYRILRVERGRVRVEDAKGAPPSIPFWLGEAPARSDELSFSVSRLRTEFLSVLQNLSLQTAAAEQLRSYLSLAKAALGVMPTQQTIVLERFFDESGGTQLVLHSPYGSRINRAWGLALRKRFCVKFNFELQAAATEDCIVLSLSTSHSFPLEEVARYLNSRSVRDVLVQAMLAAPMFTARWRWNATTALALPRFRGGRKVPAQLQRMVAEDLLASVFPDQAACADNVVGEREIPEHPLVDQTILDCLHEAMDIEGLERLLKRMESGDVRVLARDTTEPSPLALEVLSARPYAYLDDAPLEERRTQAVMGRRWLDADSPADLGRLDAEAIERVREEARPLVRDAEELHQALMQMGFMTDDEVDAGFAKDLTGQNRAARAAEFKFWIAAERKPEFHAIHPAAALEPPIEAPAEFARPWEREDALLEMVRGRASASGPFRAAQIAAALQVPGGEIEAALARLEIEGVVMRGHFTPGARHNSEWCERRLLARIHRYTVKRLRREIEPVEPRDFMRFLFEWQRVAPGTQAAGPDGLAAILAQLEGFEAPAAAWESELLPARVAEYEFTRLDDLCLAGRTVWARVSNPARAAVAGEESARASGPVRTTPIALLQRRNLPAWLGLTRPGADVPRMSSRASAALEHLRAQGASFFDELLQGTRLLRSQLEEALGELVALGLVNSDSFGGLRALLQRSAKRRGIDDAGRWSIIRRFYSESFPEKFSRNENLEQVAWTLLRRYGVVFWRLLGREADWLPPWRELLRVYHRLEARGEIRGGRFIAGLAGEHFALPDAVGLLRKLRRREPEGALVCVSGADPLNLVGALVPGDRVPALTSSRLLFRDGVPVATLVSGEVRILEPMPPAAEWEARKLLIRERRPPARVAEGAKSRAA
jgi:ATP-dependent Lhr-like helicase